MAYGHEDHCPHPGYPCICKYAPPAPAPVVTGMGCICPPGANMTCKNPLCPRGGSGEPMKIT
jgi:hypothetical protein